MSSTEHARIKLRPARNPGSNSGVGVQSMMGVEFLAGDGPATITGGFAGQWETVARPGRNALVRYVGQSPLAQDVPVLIDGFPRDRPVQQWLDSWFHWQRITGPGGNIHPTIWRVEGPIHYPQRRWVITDIEFGDAIRDRHGRLVRQALTLKLLEYIGGDTLKVHRKPLKLKPKKVKVGQKVKAKGRNMRQIARTYYGNVKAAKPLGAAQKPPVKDLGRKLSENRKVKLVRVRIP